MKYTIPALTGLAIAAITLTMPSVASAEDSAKASASPAASASAATGAKSDRAFPFKGTISSVDQTAKTFSIVGKKKTRVYKVSDSTTITKNGAAAKLSDLAANDAVSGSAVKTGDGMFDAKSVKIGGAAEKSAGKAASPSASPDASVPKG